MMGDLAIAMIVKNEIYDLERCFKSFIDNGLYPDIYCLDTGSTDNTIELAKSYGAKVKSIDSVKRFNESRNAVFDFIIESGNEYKWIMCIDADESLDENLANNIKSFISNEDLYKNYDAAWIHNMYYENIMYDSKLMIVKYEKIKSGEVKYKYWIHEELDRDNLLRERIYDIYGNLHHYSNKPNSHNHENHLKKHEFYTNIAKEYKNTEPENWYAQYIYTIQYEYYISQLYKIELYINEIRKNYDITLNKILKEYIIGNNPEFRFVMLFIQNYYDKYGINKKLKKLIFYAIEKNYIAPQLLYIIADVFYKRGGKGNILIAINYLEMLESFKTVYHEDLFQLNNYLLKEKYLELISLYSWEVGNVHKSVMAYNKLKDINSSNDYVINNKDFYNQYKLINIK